MKITARTLLTYLCLCLTLTLMTACGSLNRQGQPWEPVYGRPSMTTLPADDPADAERPKTWRELRIEAYQAETLGRAETRLEKFLNNPDTYAGRIGEFEDAPHLYAVTSAQYELMRIYYLLGEQEAGDLLFRTLDPLDLLPDAGEGTPELPE